MTEPLPSLDLIAETIRHERELLFRHADSLDSKSGIVLGTAAAAAAFLASNISTWLVPALACALLSGLACLPTFRPAKYPVWKVRGLRDGLLRSETVFTRLRITDTEIAMVERATQVLGHNARRVAAAVLRCCCYTRPPCRRRAVA